MSKVHMRALHSGHSGWLFAGASSPFLLSLPFLLFLFYLSSLLSPPLSVLFSKTDLGKRSPGKQPRGWYGGHLGSICGLWVRVKHLCCAQTQKHPNRSSGEAKTQKTNKIHCSSKTKNFLKDTIIVYKDTFMIYFIVECQRGDIASCSAEV